MKALLFLFVLMFYQQAQGFNLEINKSIVVENTFSHNMFTYNDELYWVDSQGMWKIDGTNSPYKVLSFQGGGVNGISTSVVQNRIVFNGFLYFAITSQTSGVQLWRTDGTVEGTAMIKNVYMPDVSDLFGLRGFKVINNKLIFSVFDSSQNKLWVTDGSENGTRILNNSIGADSAFSHLATINDLAFFATRNQVYKEFWITDGTINGTKRLIEISRIHTGWPDEIYFLADYNNELYFSTSTPDKGIELWKSDGTETGTILLSDINPGVSDGLTWKSQGIVFNGKLFFRANDGISGWELWETDGTSAGTVMTADINNLLGDSYPAKFFIFEDLLLFTADDGLNGRELWSTAGSTESTKLFTDMNAGSAGINLNSLEVLDMNDERLLFTVRIDKHPEIWMISDSQSEANLIFTGNDHDFIEDFHAINNKHGFFTKVKLEYSFMQPLPSPNEIHHYNEKDSNIQFIDRLTDRGNMARNLFKINNQFMFRGNDDETGYDISKFIFIEIFSSGFE